MNVETQPLPLKIKREDLKTGEVLCSYCTAKCCGYFALQIDAPETWKDFDHMRWYLMHGSVSIFVDGDAWYLMVHMDCKYLRPDFMCGIYEDRPQICRDYTTDNCEYDGDSVYDKIFESPEQLWEYAEAVLPPRPKRNAAEPFIPLPVVG